MWRFDWGVFWPILIVVFLIVGYISKQIETLNRCLLDIERRLVEIKGSALFLDAEARKRQERLARTVEESSADYYPMEQMQDLEKRHSSRSPARGPVANPRTVTEYREDT
jgi:hypothetical protein